MRIRSVTGPNAAIEEIVFLEVGQIADLVQMIISFEANQSSIHVLIILIYKERAFRRRTSKKC